MRKVVGFIVGFVMFMAVFVALNFIADLLTPFMPFIIVGSAVFGVYVFLRIIRGWGF